MNELKVTDGTTTVNLLNLEEGFSVSDWVQAVAQYKGGGTWQQSALTDEARLVAKAFDNVVEEIPIPAVSAGREDVAAAALATLMLLFEKASDYWTEDWADEPVWLESLAEGETNKQHAMIYTGGFPDIGDPYSHAYLESAALAGLTLRLVRGHWSENQPLVGTALPISAMEAWDGRNSGNIDATGARDPTTAAEVFTVNKQGVANIDEIWHYDQSTGVWTDLIAAGLPMTLFLETTAIAADDAICFGINSGAGGGPAGGRYPFSNLIFNIGTANVNVNTIWEYWDGGIPWGALGEQDNTDSTGDAFTATGVNGVWWEQATDLTRTTLLAIYGGAAPAINAFWVQCRVTGTGGAVTSPIQITRNPYTCTWPYVEVQADDIGGHIDAISKALIECRSATITDDLHFSRVIGGLRSMDRGTTFASFINLGNWQNPAGVTTAALVDASIASGPEFPVYYYIQYNPAGDRALTGAARVTIDNSDFFGTYRVFLRLEQDGGVAGDIGAQVVQAITSDDMIVRTSDTVYTRYVGKIHLLDFGIFTIPGIVPMELDATVRFLINLSNDNAPTADAHLFELIFIPVDEFAFDVYNLEDDATVKSIIGARLEIDSIIDPKRLMRTILHVIATGDLKTFYQVVAGNRLIWHSDKRQRYWFLFESPLVGSTDRVSSFYIGARNQMQAVQRYLGRRGAS